MPGQVFATKYKRYWIGLAALAVLGVGGYLVLANSGDAQLKRTQQRQAVRRVTFQS